jgi:hypothetical protein
MMPILSFLCMTAGAAVAQASDVGTHPSEVYRDTMKAQYEAHAPHSAQRPEEAQRIYDAYLKSIGQKTQNRTDNAVGTTDDQPH